MTKASTLGAMSPELRRVAERAIREPDGQFHSLAHLIDEPALTRAFHRLDGRAAPGVDGVTKERYEANLAANVRDLHRRLKEMTYRHQPIRRVHIDKAPGQTRPIGVSAFEDKIVQDAVREVLQAVYEQDFLECSHGFRPGRDCHDAVKILDRVAFHNEANWVIEADIKSFFDSVDRKKLLEMLEIRVPDGSLMRLVAKCLHAGVLDGGEFYHPEDGTTQGSVVSPLLGNIYLHYVLDLWFEREVVPRLAGKARLVRYADDFVICFEHEDDARRVMDVLPKRMAKYNLALHPDKTRLFEFRRPPGSQQEGKGPGSFDFLGFTFYWRRTLGGRWMPACKTRRERLKRTIKAVYESCRRLMHEPFEAQYSALKSRLQGHINYFGVNGNLRSVSLAVRSAERSWFAWLNRRGRQVRLTWERYKSMLEDFPLPLPRVVVRIWGGGP